MQSLPLSCSGFDAGRAAEVLLVAELAGGRTVLRRQHVGYPFHITRAFQLDRMRPDLATLYLQSASGGLYAADRLTLDLTVGAGAALNLTTQASTVVHDGRGEGAMMRQSVTVKDHAFCAIISDPYVLFPGADLHIGTIATVAVDGILIMAEGFAVHDPHHRGGTFARFSTETRIMRPDGKRVVVDRGSVRGSDLSGTCDALGGMSAACSVLVIAPLERLADIAEIEAAADGCGCLAGVTAAPSQAGLAMRLLAPDGGTLVRGIEVVFHVASRAALGVDLAPRRK
ncbi:urease accessory protein UreD [Bradyrhizobium canariense]|uniref:Urease accessory protein UreD n=1 Tax=Bradyrhizobium canariense TaxID=255045 RepID=A0A1H2B8U7_9BRAD|nr:urease accessory protein UreD [Bradyrhizobium canariense]SDT54482.1 urease accessory protein [Bradyrhizobium canariense]